MKGDDGQLAARLQRPLCRHQAFGQLGEFGIHGYADRLKAAGRRMDLAGLGARQTARDDLGQVQRGGDRRGGAGRDDCTRNPSRGALFAIVVQDIGQRFLGRAVDQISGAFAVLAHAHVQRAILGKGKPARRLIQLHRRDAKVQHNAVQRFLGKAIQVRKGACHQTQAVAKLGGPGRRHLQRQGIAVHPDHPVRPRPKQSARIAACAKGTVKPQTADRGNRGQQRAQQNRNMRQAGVSRAALRHGHASGFGRSASISRPPDSSSTATRL